jgi:hypothetical protein
MLKFSNDLRVEFFFCDSVPGWSKDVFLYYSTMSNLINAMEGGLEFAYPEVMWNQSVGHWETG